MMLTASTPVEGGAVIILMVLLLLACRSIRVPAGAVGWGAGGGVIIMLLPWNAEVVLAGVWRERAAEPNNRAGEFQTIDFEEFQTSIDTVSASRIV